MFSKVTLDIPAAITADSLGQYDEAIRVAAQWIIDSAPDESRVISLADKRHLESVPLADRLHKRHGFSLDFRNRRTRSSFSGAVLAIGVNYSDIFDVPRAGVTRIAVVPWGVDTGRYSGTPHNSSGLQPWAMGMDAEALGNGGINWVNNSSYGIRADEKQIISPLTGATRDIAESMTSLIIGSMRVDDSRDKEKVVGPLLGLKKLLGYIDKDAIAAFLWGTDWSADNIKKTLEFIDKINDGKGLKVQNRTIQPVDYSQEFAENDN